MQEDPSGRVSVARNVQLRARNVLARTDRPTPSAGRIRNGGASRARNRGHVSSKRKDRNNAPVSKPARGRNSVRDHSSNVRDRRNSRPVRAKAALGRDRSSRPVRVKGAAGRGRSNAHVHQGPRRQQRLNEGQKRVSWAAPCRRKNCPCSVCGRRDWPGCFHTRDCNDWCTFSVQHCISQERPTRENPSPLRTKLQ